MRIVSVGANTPEKDVVDIVDNSEDVNNEVEIKIGKEPEGDFDSEEVRIFRSKLNLKVRVDNGQQTNQPDKFQISVAWLFLPLRELNLV